MPFPEHCSPIALCKLAVRRGVRPVTLTQIHQCSVKTAVSYVRLPHWLAAEVRLPWQQAGGRRRSESQEIGVGGPSAFHHCKRLARSKDPINGIRVSCAAENVIVT